MPRRQIWEKMEFQKLLSSPFREIGVSKSKAKMLERELEKKKMNKRNKMKRKMGWFEMKRNKEGRPK